MRSDVDTDMDIADVATDVDIVVIGAGIAGSAAAVALARTGRSVLLLERQDSHTDLVRGEWLVPWGVTEARRLGVEDSLLRAGGSTLRWWPHWDETVVGEPDVWDLSTFVDGVGGPLTFRHARACQELTAAATAAGARTEWGVRDVALDVGDEVTVVSWRAGDATAEVRARHVIGAAGRAGPVGKLIGGELHRHTHHWGAGLAVTGVDGWPADTQAVGTEGSVMFFVFPQGDGKARLYLNFATEDRRRFAGPGGTRRFLAAFDLACLPLSDCLRSAVPDGPLGSYPSYGSWTAVVRRGNVVLIGDEAGCTDPVLGTGLAGALRDARLVVEAIAGDDPEAGLVAYVVERAERLRRLRIAADLQGMLMAEFGPEARARRAEAWRRAREDSRLATPMMATYVAPGDLPAFAFHPSVRERLVGRDLADHLRRLELVGV
jgi:flavin-dependent dehydrogenase